MFSDNKVGAVQDLHEFFSESLVSLSIHRQGYQFATVGEPDWPNNLPAQVHNQKQVKLYTEISHE